MQLVSKSHASPGIVELLINHKADVNIQDKDRRTALMHSLLEVSSEEALKLLIDNGANLTIRSNNGKTAFDIAKEHSCSEQTLELLKP